MMRFNFKKFPVLIVFVFFTSVIIGQEAFLDNFNSVSYSNNDGTRNFGANWAENGETTSASSGKILITSNQLSFKDLDNVSIGRTLDLSSASFVTLTLDYDRTNGNESILVQLYNGSTYNTVATLAGTGSISYVLTTNEISSLSAIRFIASSTNWNPNETIYIDNLLFTANFTPIINIGDVAVNEDAGTAIFTVVHGGTNAKAPFTINYQTVDGTAVAGSDYTAISGGALSFNGTAGDTEQITVVIIDDVDYESLEIFSIQFTSTSDPSVIISNAGTGTINDNEIVLSNVPLTLFDEFNGYYDYAVTGGFLRDQDNITNPCSMISSSSATGLTTTIPSSATIEKAYLLWSHSNQNPDTNVTFEGQSITADIVYSSSMSGGRMFYGMMSDVTTLINSIANPSTNIYDFTNLDVDNTNTFANYCSTSTVLGGWSLLVFYKESSLPAVSINMYHGFKGESNTSESYTLDGFFAIGSVGAKTTVLSWEGDNDLDGNSSGTTNPNGESLIVTNQAGTPFTLTGDGGQTGNNVFNSTIYDNTVSPNINNINAYGVDLDTYDISTYIAPTDSQITIQVNTGQDFVVSNMVLVKVPGNLVAGNVFEDINYGGGQGRDLLTSNGTGIEGVTVELYNGLGILEESTSTDASGNYYIGGMADGNYSVRVVNSTINSTRGGGTACTVCMPVQTFRRNFNANAHIDVNNEVGGTDPSGQDVANGTLTNAQTVSAITILSQGVADLDFGFNFNTIVNTNEIGQGSLSQFIKNANNLGNASLDIEINGIFDPAVGEDTSIFMIPSTLDPLGRSADANYSSGFFNILQSTINNLPIITAANTHIDGRTQTAYSGDTNTGTIGSGSSTVGTSGISLPNYYLPEIQIHRNDGDVIQVQADNTVVRNVSVYANANAGVLISSGNNSTISESLLGVNALGISSGPINFGVEIIGGSSLISANYISSNTDSGILVDGGTSTLIQNNHITDNGFTSCDDNITIQSGSGILIQQNLIDNAAALGIDGDGVSGGITIMENTITNSGQNGASCSGNIENSGILLDGSNSSISNNIINANAGAAIVLAGGVTSGNLISQNSMYANGTLADALGIDLDVSDNIGDGVTLNDNGDSDSGPNGVINFPIISASYTYGPNLVIKGWSRPEATIEVFLTDVNQGTASEGDNQLGMSIDYGEGQTYIGTMVEGSGSDLDGGTSAYSDMDGNLDNTNQFEFSIPLLSGVDLGDYVTATTTIANSTSEFSPFSILKVRTIITNRKITYRVNEN